VTIDKVQNNVLNQYITLLSKDTLHSVAVLPSFLPHEELNASMASSCIKRAQIERRSMKTDREYFFMTPKPIIKKVCNLSAVTSDSNVRHSAYVMFILPHNSIQLK
jgi:hypothetical protein